MGYRMIVFATLGIVLHAATVFAAAKPTVTRTTLGVPSYPGWTVHRLDDQADPSGKTRVYQYQYYSNDSVQRIVEFYEQRLNTAASFVEPTHTHTINAPDGATIQITAAPEGVSDRGDHGTAGGKTWTSLITIIRFQTQ